MNIWEILNIEKTTDKSIIRKAYAKMSKVYHPEREPEKFQELFKAYKEALEYKEYQDYLDDGDDDFWEEDSIDGKYENLREYEENSYVFTKKADNTNNTEESIEDKDKFEASAFEIVPLEKCKPAIKEGILAFIENFADLEQKNWKLFMVRPEFLRVQFEELFVIHLVKYLKEQDRYEVGELPFDLVRELYFSYRPYKEEQGEALFGDGLTDLFEIIYQNKSGDAVLEQYSHPAYQSDVVKYQIYYKIQKRVLKDKETQKPDVWMMYMSEINREIFQQDGVESKRDGLLYSMLAFVIEEAKNLSKEVFEYLFRSFELDNVKSSKRWEYIKPLYEALEKKGFPLNTNNMVDTKGKRAQEIRTLMQEIDTFCKRELTEDDRAQIYNFFRGELFEKYKLDGEFLIERLYIYLSQKELISKVWIEEYLAFYDEVYEQTNSLLGRECYNLMSSRLKNDTQVGEDYEELKEDKMEWVLKYFFEEKFTRVWNSSKPGAMKVVYRSILTNHMETLANQQNYEWDLCSEGHLYVVKEGNGYVFIRKKGVEVQSIGVSEDSDMEEVNEKVTLTGEEYYHILEELLEIFTGRYTCLPSEKKKWQELMERARETIWQ